MTSHMIFLRRFALVGALFTAAGCGPQGATGVDGSGSPGVQPAPRASQAGTTLLHCEPPASALSTSSVIGPLGGTLALGNTRVVVPANAVLVPTSFRLTIPASPLVEISIRAGDAEHYVFEQPVLVTIDYGRCADAVPAASELTVWHIDESSKALLENMSGVDLRALHTISFHTGHLSGYAVAD